METINPEIGKRVRQLRKLKNLTQQQLGELVDCTDKYISLIELGKENPSLKVLIKLSEVLEEDLSYLLQDKKSNDDLAKKINKLNKGNKEAVEGLINKLLEYQ